MHGQRTELPNPGKRIVQETWKRVRTERGNQVWFYRVRGEVEAVGPVTKDGLHRLIKNGMLCDADEIRHHHSATWTTVQALKVRSAQRPTANAPTASPMMRESASELRARWWRDGKYIAPAVVAILVFLGIWVIGLNDRVGSNERVSDGIASVVNPPIATTPPRMRVVNDVSELRGRTMGEAPESSLAPSSSEPSEIDSIDSASAAAAADKRIEAIETVHGASVDSAGSDVGQAAASTDIRHADSPTSTLRLDSSVEYESTSPPDPGSSTPDAEAGPSLPPLRRMAVVADPIQEAFVEARARFRKSTAATDLSNDERKGHEETFLSALDHALAEYSKVGENSHAKLGQIIYERRAILSAGLVGAWERQLDKPSIMRAPRREAWFISLDRDSGNWLVKGAIDNGLHLAPTPIFHGRDIKSTNASLSFALEITAGGESPWKNGARLAMKLNKDRLVCSAAGSGFELTRSANTKFEEHVVYWDGNGDFPELAAPTPPVDASDANEVFWELADLSSSTYVRENSRAWFPARQRLYLPWRSNRLTPPAAGYQRATSNVEGRYHALVAATNDPYLVEASRRARALFHTRLNIALANDRYGNTPNSSIMQLGQFLANGAVKLAEYEVERARDREASRDTDPPLSTESWNRLKKFADGINPRNLSDVIADSAQWSALMRYADMCAADDEIPYWENTLLPMAKACAGPESPEPLVEVTALWRDLRGGEKFKRLFCIVVKNTTRVKLQHATLKIEMTNAWNEVSTQFYFLSSLDAGEEVGLLPHLRWDERRLVFVNSLSVRCSIWSDQGSDTGRITELVNPVPNPNPEIWRTNYLRYDDELAGIAELWHLYFQVVKPE
jgi:hypothetical protein